MRSDSTRNDRDGRDLLFCIQEACLGPLRSGSGRSVDGQTQLRGKETYFLPFNRGNNYGAGNPPVEGNWKTHYLWDEVLQSNSLLENPANASCTSKGRRSRLGPTRGCAPCARKTMIFPRYHQLDSVRKLVAHAKVKRLRQEITLFQHSAGFRQVKLYCMARPPTGQPA